jgi:predicted TIM-barrel fold metal-dependent hydrolase
MTSLSEDLYNEIPKFDAHIHQNVKRTAILDAADKDGFQLVSINTEIPDFPSITDQRDVISALNEDIEDPATLNFITTFSTENWGETGWQDDAIEQIKKGLEKGGIAVKIWKNIGMELKDGDGNYLMADHPSFDPIYEFLADEGIPLAAHQGEPKNCWLPLEKMTVESDRDYFSKHPEYHMYQHDDVPSYYEHLSARDEILNKHPELNFIGLHLASHEWSVKKVADWLDQFPNAAVDLAERVCHLQYQAINNHQKVKEFVEAYQDRIIYGSDQIDDGQMKAEKIQKLIRSKWTGEFNFFASGDVQSAWNVSQPFKGLGLSKNILQKIFYDNALKYYPRIQDSN